MTYHGPVRFEWDPQKEPERREARCYLQGSQGALRLQDAEHSDAEERLIAIGPIRRGLVMVVFVERSEETIRIVSARWASKSERALYLEYMEKDT